MMTLLDGSTYRNGIAGPCFACGTRTRGVWHRTDGTIRNLCPSCRDGKDGGPTIEGLMMESGKLDKLAVPAPRSFYQKDVEAARQRFAQELGKAYPTEIPVLDRWFENEDHRHQVLADLIGRS